MVAIDIGRGKDTAMPKRIDGGSISWFLERIGIMKNRNPQGGSNQANRQISHGGNQSEANLLPKGKAPRFGEFVLALLRS